jgi:hypothetical protein
LLDPTAHAAEGYKDCIIVIELGDLIVWKRKEPDSPTARYQSHEKWMDRHMYLWPKLSANYINDGAAKCP